MSPLADVHRHVKRPQGVGYKEQQRLLSFFVCISLPPCLIGLVQRSRTPVRAGGEGRAKGERSHPIGSGMGMLIIFHIFKVNMKKYIEVIVFRFV